MLTHYGRLQEKVAIQEEVRARKVVLVNEQGTPVAAFGMVGGQLSLALRDENKKVRAVIGVDQEGQPGVFMLDENGKIRAKFDVEENEPRLLLLDENGKILFKAPQ